MRKKIKIGLICSRGGHLLQLYLLQKWWSNYPRFWITGKGEDSSYLLKNEKVYFAFFPEHRNFFSSVRNFFWGFNLIRKEKPKLLFSTGAGISPPILLAGKILGCKTVFLDSYTFRDYPSLSAKIASLFVDKLLVQHQKAKMFLARSEYWGSIL